MVLPCGVSHESHTNKRAWTTHERAVGLPKQHSFCIFFSDVVSCYSLAHTMELTGDMVELMLPNGSNSSPPRPLLRRTDTAQTWGNEPWSVPSVYHNINDKAFTVTKVKVRCIKVWWISSPGLFLSLWPLPLRFDARFVAKNISGRPTNTLRVFMVIGSWSTELWFYSRPNDTRFYWCHHHHFQIRMQTIDSNKCL